MKNFDPVVEEFFTRTIESEKVALQLLWAVANFPAYPLDRLMLPTTLDVFNERLKEEAYDTISKNSSNLNYSQVSHILVL